MSVPELYLAPMMYGLTVGVALLLGAAILTDTAGRWHGCLR